MARNAAIDVWKGWSIFGVVWIHCAFLVPHRPAHLDVLSPMWTFGVPLFLVYWAYFQACSARRPAGPGNPRWARARNLLLRFLFWSTVYWLLEGDFQSGLLHQISRHWSGYGWPGQYFFLLLLQAILVFPLIRKLSDRIPFWANIAATVAVLGLVGRIWNLPPVLAKIGDRPVVFWLPELVLGCHLASGRFPRIRIPEPFLVAGIAAIGLESAFLPTSAAILGPYFLVAIFLSTAAIAVSTVSAGSGTDAAASGRLARFMTLLSRRSMAIFCINPLVLVVLGPWLAGLPPVSFPGVWIVLPILNTSLAVGLSLAVAAILDRIGLGPVAANG